MAWASENATKAYLQNLKMGKLHKEPEINELISALAAGNGARLMVEACNGQVGPTTLALVAAANQTGGRVVCILPRQQELRRSMEALGRVVANAVEFVVGDASTLLLSDYPEADFVLIDCNLEDHEDVLRAAQMGQKGKEVVVVGYNAFQGGPWRDESARSVFLPVGDGLRVVRTTGGGRKKKKMDGCGLGRSRWVVTMDRCTGEEHVFRITNPLL